MTEPQPKPVVEMSFEEALRELETIVQRLERGDVPLQESISQYERGDKLRAHCDKLLQAAEAKVEKIRRGNDATASGTEPLDVE
ncbi:exodeoxyribonuclease VII small subunit [Breoghania corrubedonensis]|uniref:Exodeoxyribonuclease 7 small subunit n=1 Tax=Breoghania corrubedonensis TaxID=665038 RepID=A0A2T5VEI6_9HYPH|nr:exodeoxyribonuclease VII small subunit [Breoghania corrubedonensis]PTW62169.1 exodeoxyribonuclease VII small subunit [Breoghania corrubedonensis]